MLEPRAAVGEWMDDLDLRASRGMPKEVSSLSTLSETGNSRDLSARTHALVSILREDFKQSLIK
jgi:hypothetical protein